MIPAGYLYKRVACKPPWLKAAGVDDIYSVSGCISEDFIDWLEYWQHNGFWLFNAPDIMVNIAEEQGVSLNDLSLFFYRVSEKQWHDEEAVWRPHQPDAAFLTDVVVPAHSQVEGYDVVSIYAGNACECSPLSCNGLATTLAVNRHCLLPTYDAAKQLLESGAFHHCEPGPYRIFEVHSISNVNL